MCDLNRNCCRLGKLTLTPVVRLQLRRALAATHRRYAGILQVRRKRTGHFWQGRFGSVVLDEEHLAAAVRYVPLNPVRARLVARAQDWRWSSVRAHLPDRDDGLTTLAPVLERFAPFRAFLEEPPDREAVERLRARRKHRAAAWEQGVRHAIGEALRADAAAGQARPQAAQK
jgi:putative transposase